MIARSCAVLLAILATAGPALGHAKLLVSSPAANAHLTEAPKTLSLTFSEAAQLGVLKLTSSGKEVPLMLDRAAKPAASVTIALPALQPGIYEIEWSALAADDGHVTRGRFSFTVAAVSRPPP